MRGLRVADPRAPAGRGHRLEQPEFHLRKRARLLHSLGLDSSLGTLIIVLVVGLLLNSLISLFVMRKVGYANAEVANLMRVRLIRQMLGASWSYLLEHPTGRIANAFSGEVGRSQQAYQLAAQFVAEAVETVGDAACWRWLVSWKLAAASIAIGLATAAAVHFLVARAKRAGRAQTAADQGAGEPADRHAGQSEAAQGHGRPAGVRRRSSTAGCTGCAVRCGAR